MSDRNFWQEISNSIAAGSAPGRSASDDVKPYPPFSDKQLDAWERHARSCIGDEDRRAGLDFLVDRVFASEMLGLIGRARAVSPNASEATPDGFTINDRLLLDGPFASCHDCGGPMIWESAKRRSWICPCCVWERLKTAEADRDKFAAGWNAADARNANAAGERGVRETPNVPKSRAAIGDIVRGWWDGMPGRVRITRRAWNPDRGKWEYDAVLAFHSALGHWTAVEENDDLEVIEAAESEDDDEATLNAEYLEQHPEMRIEGTTQSSGRGDKE